MLRQHVEWTRDGQARLDRAGLDPVARRRNLDQLERVRRHTRHSARRARAVTAPPRALEQAGDALRAANLEHAIDWREVDAEVEARRRDDTPQASGAQARLHPVSCLPVQRSVVQRDDACPVGARAENGLIPDLRLRAGVGKDDGTLALFDGFDNLRQHLRAEVPGPGKARDDGRYERVDNDLLWLDSANDASGWRTPVRRAAA